MLEKLTSILGKSKCKFVRDLYSWNVIMLVGNERVVNIFSYSSKFCKKSRLLTCTLRYEGQQTAKNKQ